VDTTTQGPAPEAGQADEPIEWGQIEGVPICFPMVVASMNQATLVFSVPAAAASALLPGDTFEVVEAAPGVAQFVVALCDYVDNPWGDYDEVNLGFLVRPRGHDDIVNSFVYRMPVNQAFTCRAGNEVMGFPKTVEEIDVDYSDATVTFRLAMDGHEVLRVRLPRVAGDGGQAPVVETLSYSYLDGVPHETQLAMEMGTGMIDPGDVEIEVGTGPVADELRSLGLPSRPDLATWGEGLSATFHLPQPVV
jgi:hypothetical protein